MSAKAKIKLNDTFWHRILTKTRQITTIEQVT